MKLVVHVDGKKVYEDRTFKLDEALDLVKIAMCEGQIPTGGLRTSVMLLAEGPFPVKQLKENLTLKEELEVEAEEKPACDDFREGMSYAF